MTYFLWVLQNWKHVICKSIVSSDLEITDNPVSEPLGVHIEIFQAKMSIGGLERTWVRWQTCVVAFVSYTNLVEIDMQQILLCIVVVKLSSALVLENLSNNAMNWFLFDVHELRLLRELHWSRCCDLEWILCSGLGENLKKLLPEFWPRYLNNRKICIWCKWRYLVVKFDTHASGTDWLTNVQSLR